MISKLEKEIEAFVACPEFRLQNANVGFDHFYTQEEKAKFVKKWKKYIAGSENWGHFLQCVPNLISKQIPR